MTLNTDINREMLEDESRYKILVMLEDSDKLSNVITALSDVKSSDVIGINDDGEMLSLLKNDHTYDILVLDYGENEKEALNLVKQIRKHNTSLFIVFVVNDHADIPSMEMLSRYNVQGYCKDKDGYDELKVWIHSGIRILEQTKMLKQLYVQTKNQAETIRSLNTKLTSSYYETINTLRLAVDKKDPYTRGHSDRVAYISAMIAEELNFSQDEIDKIRLGGQFHDIGKIGIKDSILTKAGPLTKEEYDEIKKHPIIGYELLETNNIFKDILPAIRNHHERYDGTGYPDGLKGNAIPIMARIIGVADAFDAMMSKRSYRDKLELDYTMEEIKKNRGLQFDPKVADAFIHLIDTRYNDLIKITGEY